MCASRTSGNRSHVQSAHDQFQGSRGNVCERCSAHLVTTRHSGHSNAISTLDIYLSQFVHCFDVCEYHLLTRLPQIANSTAKSRDRVPHANLFLHCRSATPLTFYVFVSTYSEWLRPQARLWRLFGSHRGSGAGSFVHGVLRLPADGGSVWGALTRPD